MPSPIKCFTSHGYNKFHIWNSPFAGNDLNNGLLSMDGKWRKTVSHQLWKCPQSSVVNNALSFVIVTSIFIVLSVVQLHLLAAALFPPSAKIKITMRAPVTQVQCTDSGRLVPGLCASIWPLNPNATLALWLCWIVVVGCNSTVRMWVEVRLVTMAISFSATDGQQETCSGRQRKGRRSDSLWSILKHTATRMDFSLQGRASLTVIVQRIIKLPVREDLITKKSHCPVLSLGSWSVHSYAPSELGKWMSYSSRAECFHWTF